MNYLKIFYPNLFSSPHVYKITVLCVELDLNFYNFNEMPDSFECDTCGTKLSTKILLVQHLNQHKILLNCNVCGKSYKSLNNLKYHLKIHFDENYYRICDLCGKSVSKWKLKRHIERHDPKKKTLKSEKSFLCRFCGLVFNKINNRTSHEKRIHKTKANLGLENFKCIDCSSVFRTKEELREHSFEHFSGKIHFCNFPGCNRYFKKGKLVTVHKRCHYEPQFKCLDCSAAFVQKSGLAKHQKERCPVKKLNIEPSSQEIEKNASIARIQFVELKGRLKSKRNSDKSNKLVNTKTETKGQVENKLQKTEEDWQYEFLDEALMDEKSMTNSQIFVETISTNQATKCDPTDSNSKNDDSLELVFKGETNSKNSPKIIKNFKQTKKKPSKDLNESIKTANDTKIQKTKNEQKVPKLFICDYCGKEYRSRSSIVTHLLVTHKTVADFNCTHCCRKFKSHGNLTRHIRAVHSDGKQFGCEKCGAMFKEKYQLEIHIHNHDERKISLKFFAISLDLIYFFTATKCNLCNKMVSNLKVHLRHHASKTNNTTVKCPMCDKIIGKYQLIRHIKTVHEKQYQPDTTKLNLKIYTCKDCGDYFSRRQDLRQHEYLNHSRTKIYECKVCGTYFKKLKLLNVHRFSHQPLNISCQICNKVYARKGALWKHQKKSHPEIVLKNKQG